MFGCQSCFCKPVFLQKQLIYDFLAGNNYPDSPHSQGVWNLPHKFHPYLIKIYLNRSERNDRWGSNRHTHFPNNRGRISRPGHDVSRSARVWSETSYRVEVSNDWAHNFALRDAVGSKAVVPKATKDDVFGICKINEMGIQIPGTQNQDSTEDQTFFCV